MTLSFDLEKLKEAVISNLKYGGSFVFEDCIVSMNLYMWFDQPHERDRVRHVVKVRPNMRFSSDKNNVFKFIVEQYQGMVSFFNADFDVVNTLVEKNNSTLVSPCPDPNIIAQYDKVSLFERTQVDDDFYVTRMNVYGPGHQLYLFVEPVNMNDSRMRKMFVVYTDVDKYEVSLSIQTNTRLICGETL